MATRKPRKKKAPREVVHKTGRVLVGSCLERLRELDDASVSSIVTDPPYELAFMGKAWDASGIAYNVDVWRECLRVLKPGGHLLAFGGTRTYHRMVVAIEDAGFEIRDSVHWIYGSGFPKSLDVSKAIDKQRHDRADVYRVTAWIREARDAAKKTNRDIDAAFGFSGMAGHWTTDKSQPAVPTIEQIPDLLDVLALSLDDVPGKIRKLLWELNGKKGQPGPNWAKREVTGQHEQPPAAQVWQHNVNGTGNLTAKERRDIPTTVAAKQWQGWGTALKPAHEPIVVARKPLDGTVANNVTTHGTGALNIDGCRIGRDEGDVSTGGYGNGGIGIGGVGENNGEGKGAEWVESTKGRWPANVIFDEAAGAELDAQSGIRTPGHWTQSKTTGFGEFGGGTSEYHGTGPKSEPGGASRFFYCPKPSRSERNAGLVDLEPRRQDEDDYERAGTTNPRNRSQKLRKNFHPTVKPVALIAYLVRLVTPPGGVVLDPFLGSGTTAVAAIDEGFSWIGCELTLDYLPIISGRVRHAEKKRRKK